MSWERKEAGEKIENEVAEKRDPSRGFDTSVISYGSVRFGSRLKAFILHLSINALSNLTLPNILLFLVYTSHFIWLCVVISMFISCPVIVTLDIALNV